MSEKVKNDNLNNKITVKKLTFLNEKIRIKRGHSGVWVAIEVLKGIELFLCIDYTLFLF